MPIDPLSLGLAGASLASGIYGMSKRMKDRSGQDRIRRLLAQAKGQNLRQAQAIAGSGAGINPALSQRAALDAVTEANATADRAAMNQEAAMAERDRTRMDRLTGGVLGSIGAFGSQVLAARTPEKGVDDSGIDGKEAAIDMAAQIAAKRERQATPELESALGEVGRLPEGSEGLGSPQRGPGWTTGPVAGLIERGAPPDMTGRSFAEGAPMPSLDDRPLGVPRTGTATPSYGLDWGDAGSPGTYTQQGATGGGANIRVPRYNIDDPEQWERWMNDPIEFRTTSQNGVPWSPGGVANPDAWRDTPAAPAAAQAETNAQRIAREYGDSASALMSQNMPQVAPVAPVAPAQQPQAQPAPQATPQAAPAPAPQLPPESETSSGLGRPVRAPMPQEGASGLTPPVRMSDVIRQSLGYPPGMSPEQSQYVERIIQDPTTAHRRREISVYLRDRILAEAEGVSF